MVLLFLGTNTTNNWQYNHNKHLGFWNTNLNEL